MTRTLLLVLHISGVAAWLGANFVQLVLTPRFAKAQHTVAKAWTDATIMMGERYYTAAGAVIAISGVFLVLEGDFSWSAGFVLLGIATVAMGAILGVALFGPVAKRRSAAFDSGDVAGARATLRTIVPAARFDTALLLVTLMAMIEKWKA